MKGPLYTILADAASQDTSASIQLNVSVESQQEPHVAEVQLVLQNMIMAKDQSEKVNTYIYIPYVTRGAPV